METKRWFIIVLAFFINAACSEKEQDQDQKPKEIWDIDRDGIPRFVEKNYIDLAKIRRISKFRSSVGHDYSDAFEHCRNMKHYFEPYDTCNWATISVFSPVKGKISRLEQEWAGTKIEIVSDDYPAFRFTIFHVNMVEMHQINDVVEKGEFLGTHIGLQTMSDIAVIVNDPSRQGRMVSYFETLKDSVFLLYQLRGVESRQSFIISKELRDASPLICNGDQFATYDTLQNWVLLN